MEAARADAAYNSKVMRRRGFLAGLGLLRAAGKLPPVRAITRRPKFHWFGCYDKLQFDPSSRYALRVEGSFEHRRPAPAGKIRIGMVDLYTGYWRCDTTPRFSPNGRRVIVDSPHGGNGRQMYLIDVSEIVGGL